MQSIAENVIGRDGLRGALIDQGELLDDRVSDVAIRLTSGEEVRVPKGVLKKQDDGSYFLPLGPSDLAVTQQADRQVVPVIEERLDIRKRLVETGVVRITKTVQEREEIVDEPIYGDSVEVRRVAVNRPVDGPIAVREENGVTIVPIMEEVLVVEKRLILKEELHIVKRREEIGREQQTVSLRREEAAIERIDAQS